MQIQPPTVRRGNPLVGFFIFLVLLAGAVFALGSFFYYKNTSSLLPVTIGAFPGKVEISSDGKTWQKPKYNTALKPPTYVRTGADGEMDLQVGKTAYLRLKENGLIRFMRPAFFLKAQARFHVNAGKLLVANQGENIQISFNPALNQALKNFWQDASTQMVESEGIYAVTVDATKKFGRVDVLRGKLTVSSLLPKMSSTLKDMESGEKIGSGAFHKTKIIQTNWRNAREAYEVKPVDTGAQSSQLDLSKKAGNFFNYVLDHGTFYQKNYGWCERTFIAPAGGAPTYLETIYDVFPVGSWVGVYIKTKNLDLSKFRTFKVDARRIPGKSHPENIRLEFKSKYQVVQAYVIKRLNKNWETITFPVRLAKESPINEMTIIFSNNKVGNHKTGGVQFRNFTLEEAAQAKQVPTEDASSLKVPVAVGANESALTLE